MRVNPLEERFRILTMYKGHSDLGSLCEGSVASGWYCRKEPGGDQCFAVRYLMYKHAV